LRGGEVLEHGLFLIKIILRFGEALGDCGGEVFQNIARHTVVGAVVSESCGVGWGAAAGVAAIGFVDGFV
jgi:hypothetical protein